MGCGAHCVHRTKFTSYFRFGNYFKPNPFYYYYCTELIEREREEKIIIWTVRVLDSAIFWRSILPHSFSYKISPNSICDFATLRFNYTNPIKSEFHHVNNNDNGTEKTLNFFPRSLLFGDGLRFFNIVPVNAEHE